MKRFLIQLFLFISPFIILIIIAQTCYSKSGGDLNRIGKVSVISAYRDQFKADFRQRKKRIDISEIDFDTINNFDVLSIGDSFSQQELYGYQNYLGNLYELEVANLDVNNLQIKSYQPLDFLYQASKGDFFDKVKPKCVVLQVVERDFVKQALNLDAERRILISEIKMAKMAVLAANGLNYNPDLFNDVILFYKYNLGYFFNERAYSSNVYKMKLNTPLFSANSSSILFYYREIANISLNTQEYVSNLNNVLNSISLELEAKGIKLIVLVAADKYDVYYEYIENNRFPENAFFPHFDTYEKQYLYINSKALLKPYIDKGEQDIYFADDTHWSPKATKIVARKISSLINNSK